MRITPPPPPPYPGGSADRPIMIDDDDVKPGRNDLSIPHIDRIRQRNKEDRIVQRRNRKIQEKREMRENVVKGCPRDPIWYNWHYAAVIGHYDTLVAEGRWSELESVLDGEAQARGRPQCTKKASAIRNHLQDMDMLEIMGKALMEDEPVILTHDEHEFLAGPNGNRIIDAVQNKNLAALSAVLCKEMALCGQIHDDLNIHERPSDKLYDILKAQVADAKGWFHLIHKRYQKQQEAIAEVEWAAEQRLRKALREQEERLKREHGAKMKAFADFDRQVLRGG